MIIGQDTFQRINVPTGSWGTATDQQVYAQMRGTQTLDVTANVARMTFSTTTTGIMALGTNRAVDAEGLLRFQVSTATDLAGISLRFQDSNNFYSCVVGNTANTITFRRDLASTFTTIGTAAAFTYSTGVWLWMRFRIQGTTLYAKAWADGSAEPAGWMMTATDSGITAPGRFGIVGTPTASGNTTLYTFFSVDDLVPPEPLSQPRWTPRALSALLFKPYPSVPLPAWVARPFGSTFVRPTSPVNIPRYVRRGLSSLLSNYALNISTRFRLMSADVLNDISTRFILVGGTQQLKDIVSRLRLRSADVLKDIATRLRLRSADQLKDIIARLRLRSADQLKDISTRFILATASQRLKDIVSRLRLMSAAQLKDIATRLRLMSASQLRDITTRFRQRSADQLKDISSRLRLRSANVLKDVTTRLRLMSASQLRDIASRFILVGQANLRLRDISCRLVLVAISDATWITRDLQATWRTRDDKAGWQSRDEQAAWDTRDDKATWDTRDDLITWKTRR